MTTFDRFRAKFQSALALFDAAGIPGDRKPDGGAVRIAGHGGLLCDGERWFWHSRGIGGGPIEAAAVCLFDDPDRVKGQDFRAILERFAPELLRDDGDDRPQSRRGPEAIYHYNSEDGSPLYRKLRYRKPDGSKITPFQKYVGGPAEREESWRGAPGCMKGVRRVLYRLERIVHDPRARRVAIVEGEKCVDILWDFGIVATCNDDGAGKWRADYNAFLAGREIAVIPDNDGPGREHAELVAESVSTVAARVQLLELPGLAMGEDVYDWLSRRGNEL